MLTDLECRRAKPREKDYSLADARGLYLAISTTGGKHWRSRYSFLGKLNWHSIGPYPEVSIAKARVENQKIRDMVRDNINPAQFRKENKKRLVAEHETTFEVVAKIWFDHKKTRIVPKHAQAVWRSLENHIFPSFGKKPIRQIGIPDVLDALKKVEARGAHDLVRRIKQNCREIFAYAIIHQLTSTNPAAMFEAKDVFARYDKGHFASIEPDEIPAFLGTIRHNKHRLQPITHIAIELMLLTFVRTSELIMARWEEVDFDKAEWLIPAERMKMRRPHLVPLCKQSIALLQELKTWTGHRDFLFPNRNDPRSTMSNNTILQALKSLGYGTKMTGHGFRALAMTAIKEKLGYRHEVIDLQLAHAKKDKIQAAYDRAQFLDERRTMMQAWADYLDNLPLKGQVIHAKFRRGEDVAA